MPIFLCPENVFCCIYISALQTKGVCALIGYFGPTMRPKNVIAFHKFRFISLLE